MFILVIGASVSCRRGSLAIPQGVADYEGEVTERQLRVGEPGPMGGPAGLYRLLVERGLRGTGPRQASVAIDSATRAVSSGVAAKSRHSLATGGRKFVRVWFRTAPTRTDIEVRGRAATVVLDSVQSRSY